MDLFLAACHRQPTARTPVWLMRQAGRYLPEYRKIRERVEFLELCRRPDLAAEVTVQPVDRLGVDAAILFADILLVVEPLGVDLTFARGDGPVIGRPVASGVDVARLPEFDAAEALAFVFETVRRVVVRLGGRVPLIGFAGAPFTVASYLVEGGASRDYLRTKRLMYEDPQAWHALLALLARITARYLEGQVRAGVQAVQLFDSWVGALSPDDYRAFVLPHTRAVVQALSGVVPVIHFGTGTAGLLEAVAEVGADVVGLDWRVDLDRGWARLGPEVAVQGNLDPAALFLPPAEIRRRVARILGQAGGRPGHVFNLGHGVLPGTPVEHVVALVQAVRELSVRG